MADRIDHTSHGHPNTPEARRFCRKFRAESYAKDGDFTEDSRKAWWLRHEAAKRHSARVAQRTDEALEMAREKGLLGPWRIGGPVMVSMSDAEPQRARIVNNSNPNYVTVQLDRSGMHVPLLRHYVTPIED